MSTVYLGRVRGVAGFERLFAIKVCHPHLARDRAFSAMFLDEARLAARIHHPNVVATIDLGADAQLFLVMDYVEGGSLAALQRMALTRAPRQLPLEIALSATRDALVGLHAAHELRDAAGESLGVVHRDVSPHNILVGTDGTARITDFGIARARERLAETTGAGHKGKLSYMSPEQVLGQPVDRRSDVFAAGVVLWELVTGCKLFIGDAPGAVTHALLTAPIPAPSMVNFSLPKALDPIVARALDRRPDHRFAGALAFAEAIEQSGLALAPIRTVASYVEQTLAGELRQLRSAVSAQASTPVLSKPDGPAAQQEKPGERWRALSWRLAAVLIALGSVAGLLIALSLGSRASGPVAGKPTPALRSAPAPASTAGTAAPPSTTRGTSTSTRPKTAGAQQAAAPAQAAVSRLNGLHNGRPISVRRQPASRATRRPARRTPRQRRAQAPAGRRPPTNTFNPTEL